MYNLLVVAHPDDEVIFFSGLLLNMRELPWTVICVTANYHETRRKFFRNSCSQLGVQAQHWNFPDVYEIRLDIKKLVEQLGLLVTPNAVFTHSIRGDYGHPHHQDVCHAVHQAFAGHDKVYSLAYTEPPELSFSLSEAQVALRYEILEKTYGIPPWGFLQLPHSDKYDSFTRLEYDPNKAYDLHPRAKKSNA